MDHKRADRIATLAADNAFKEGLIRRPYWYTYGRTYCECRGIPFAPEEWREDEQPADHGVR
jgi:hypothetical protein